MADAMPSANSGKLWGPISLAGLLFQGPLVVEEASRGLLGNRSRMIFGGFTANGRRTWFGGAVISQGLLRLEMKIVGDKQTIGSEPRVSRPARSRP